MMSKLPLLFYGHPSNHVARLHCERRLDTAFTRDHIVRSLAKLLSGLTGDDEVAFHVESDIYRCTDELLVREQVTSNTATVTYEDTILLTFVRPSQEKQISCACIVQVDISTTSVVHLFWNSVLFSAEFGKALLDQFISILHGSSWADTVLAIANPDAANPSDLLLHQLFTRNTHSDPALIFYQQPPPLALTSFTYGQIDQLSTQMALKICQMNLRRSIILVALSQSPQLYVAILAILKSDNVYCPLLVDTSAERAALICKDTKAELAICAAWDAYIFPSTIATFYPSLDVCSSPTDDSVLKLSISGQDLAYVMYTSGSTGIPKAVMITHEAASTSILAHDNIFRSTGATSHDRMLQFANPTFDISIFEIFAAWANGLTLVTAPRNQLLSDLPQIVSDLNIKYMELTPSVAGLLPSQDDPRLKNVECLITIGEMLTQRVIEGWSGKLWNAYGPTETTFHASYQKVDQITLSSSIIGQPIQSCTVSILDTDSVEILPLGWVGEICISGPQVAAGYLNREELTDAVFIEHPNFKGKLYRTGDLGRIVDGIISVVGRKGGDQQIKINGQRIELGEISHVILSRSYVQDCSMIYNSGELVAFVVPKKGEWKDSMDLGTLPLDVRPRIVILDSIPRSASGKTDSKKLLAMAKTSQKTASTSDTLMDTFESKVQDVVSTVIKRSVGREDSLAKFGLDSLGAIRIVMKMHDLGKSPLVQNLC